MKIFKNNYRHRGVQLIATLYIRMHRMDSRRQYERLRKKNVNIKKNTCFKTKIGTSI